MKKLTFSEWFLFGIALLMTVFFTGSSMAGTGIISDSDKIGRAYQSNGIQREDYIVQTLKSYFSPDRTDIRFKISNKNRFTRKITLLLIEARRNLDSYSEESKAYLDMFFRRPDHVDYEDEGTNFYLPDPISSFVPDATLYPNIGNKFKFWYVTHATADSSGNVHTSTLDFVKKMAAAFEYVYQKEVVDMGYAAPPDDANKDDNGGDAKFDVYVMNCGYSGTYGFVVPEDWVNDLETGPTANGFYSFMVMDNNFLEFATESQTEEEAMKVTAAHEFHHVIQMGINIDASVWYTEATATWMEDQVYDDINDNRQYISDFFLYPETALDAGDPHWYSTWIWNEFLETRFNQTIIKQIWENLDPLDNNDAIDAISTQLIANGSTFKDSFTEFVAKNYSKTGFYKDASDASYSQVDIINNASPHTLDTNSTQLPQQVADVSHLASKYYKFVPGTGIAQTSSLSISVDGKDNKEVNAIAIVKKVDGSFEETNFTLDPTTKQGSVNITEFTAENITEVVLGLVNYSKTDDNTEIKYSANLVTGTTCDDVPGKVSLISHFPSQENNTLVLSWNEDSCTTWYKLFIGDSSEEKVHAQWYDSTDICSGGNCSITLESELPSGSYEWWVKSWNDYGSVWSDGMSFTVQVPDNPPSKVTHTSPSGQIQDSTPTCTWVEDSVSTWYKFWVGYPNGDKVFAKWYDAEDICSDGNCSVTLGLELIDGDYEWYVKSWNDYGRIWSDGMSFTVSD